LDNRRQVAVCCEFLATMDAMEEVLQKKKTSCAAAWLGGCARGAWPCGVRLVFRANARRFRDRG